ncbi:universal stress protein [Aureliella helgolandensis]|uniref:Universal stress protein n=1 Tax=Aureliella helgolandensis TaxID=2527968 RepID=A0A518GD17_9BACT|nr:universal stress protein [Aureliella helgolandensis]QDV26495.1 Putative universal stress protein [Aureliella helgolandensis]
MHLLLAIDGSQASAAALHYLARLPFAAKPKVTLVTALVGSFTDDVGLPLGEAEENAASETAAEAKAFLESAGFQCEHVIEYGHASKIILDKGKELDVDLIVLGAHGHSAAYRIILGSTANFVANHARCPVLVVRPHESPDADAEKFKVLLAYDMSAQAKVALQQMLAFDWPADATLTLATFFEKPQLIDEEDVYDAETLSEASKTLAEIRGKAKVKCSTDQIVREAKHIGDGLRDLSIEKETNLLFLGDTGKSALARFFLGSISRHLLHHVQASTWIAREKQWK